MRLENTVTVDAPLEEVWTVLQDIPRVADCMPGAQLTASSGDRHEGTVTVRLGPMKATYQGVATVEEFDSATRRARLVAEGRETKGQGQARADVALTAAGDDRATTLSIETDLQITGRVAQFGRGLLQDVSSNLLGEFAQRLADELGRKEEPEPVAAAPDASAQPSEAEEPATLEAWSFVAGPLARRVLPPAALVLLLWLLVRWARRRR